MLVLRGDRNLHLACKAMDIRGKLLVLDELSGEVVLFWSRSFYVGPHGFKRKLEEHALVQLIFS